MKIKNIIKITQKDNMVVLKELRYNLVWGFIINIILFFRIYHNPPNNSKYFINLDHLSTI